MCRGMVLVDQRARLVAYSWMGRVCVCRTAAGVTSSPGTLASPESTVLWTRTSTLRMALDESTGLALKKAVASSPDWLLCRGLQRNASSYAACVGHLFPAGVSSREVVANKRRTCHGVLGLPVSRIGAGLCWDLSFRGRVLAALSLSSALRLLTLLLGMIYPTSFPARCRPWLPSKHLPHVAEVSDASPNGADEVRVGQPPRDFLRCNTQEPLVPSPPCSR